MARRKNVKRIDPRYFLHETATRGEEEKEPDVEELEEGGPHAEEDEEELEEGPLDKLKKAGSWLSSPEAALTPGRDPHTGEAPGGAAPRRAKKPAKKKPGSWLSSPEASWTPGRDPYTGDAKKG